MRIYLFVILFSCCTLNILAQNEKRSHVVVNGFGGTVEYLYQDLNVISVGPNFCIGVMKDDNSRGPSFYSVEALYSGVIKQGNYYNGFKGGFNYNYTGNKGVGFNSNLHCLIYNQNTLLTPSIGISYMGIITLQYGYSFKLSKGMEGEKYTPHQIGIKIFLNKALGLMFKMV